MKIFNLKDTKMSQGRMIQRTSVLLAAISVIGLFSSGCDCSKKLETAQKDNQALTQRIAELEGQLSQTEAAVAAQAQAVGPQPLQVKDTIPATTPAPAVQPQVAPSVYVVKEGDNLWKIAKNQLGDGSRYKEILALNLTIKKDKPLMVGTKLTMPPR
jgi:nucleoid-associated protein YgaU